MRVTPEGGSPKMGGPRQVPRSPPLKNTPLIMNTLFHFLLLFQLYRSLRNIPLGDRILGKSKVLITVGCL